MEITKLQDFKGYLELLGLGHSYHDLWWRRNVRQHSPLTPWNYDRNVIFVHIPKTAGLSIYEMFGMDYPPDTHAPVAGYQQADATLFKTAYKFAVVRNPWDRLVSAFHYLKHNAASPNEKQWSQDQNWAERHLVKFSCFSQFMQALHAPDFRRLVLTWRHFIPQHYFLTSGGSDILVDHVIYYEDLQKGLEEVAHKIGVALKPVHRNVSKRSGFRQYYRQEDIDLVGSIYARDIELFSYSFACASAAGG